MNPGDQFGRYRIVERIGQGGMGVLYRGTDPILDREVAIKVMAAGAGGDDDGGRERFLREAKASARLQHRNIVTVFEFGEEDGVPFLAMEFLRGRTLAARLHAPPPVTIDEAIGIVAQLCAGLQYAHESGVVHRDVKPSNVWLTDDGTVKLLDFGIAKLLQDAGALTQRGAVLGSAEYMAPEQITGGDIDGRADVFSAAAILYELVAGRKPFGADSPTGTLERVLREPAPPLDATIPPPLAAAIQRGLEKAPGDRFASASELVSELQMIRGALQAPSDTMFGYERRVTDGTTVSAGRRATVIPPRAAVAPRVSAAHRSGSRARAPWMPLMLGAAAIAVGLGTLNVLRPPSPPVEQRPPRAAAAPAVPEAPPAPVGPVMQDARGMYFAYRVPAGWRIVEHANGIDMIDPGSPALVSLTLILSAPGKAAPDTFLASALGMIGATATRVESQQALSPLEAGDAAWQRRTAVMQYQREACDCRAGVVAAVRQGPRSYAAVLRMYQTAADNWSRDEPWLAEMARAIQILDTRGVPSLGSVFGP